MYLLLKLISAALHILRSISIYLKVFTKSIKFHTLLKISKQLLFDMKSTFARIRKCNMHF